jgi:hypothetical protein
MLRGCGKSGDVTNTSPDLRRVALGALLTAAPGDGKANGTSRSRPASPKCSAFPCVRYARAAPTSRTEQPPAREAGSNCGTPGRRRLAGGEPETESSEEREKTEGSRSGRRRTREGIVAAMLLRASAMAAAALLEAMRPRQPVGTRDLRRELAGSSPAPPKIPCRRRGHPCSSTSRHLLHGRELCRGCGRPTSRLELRRGASAGTQRLRPPWSSIDARRGTGVGCRRAGAWLEAALELLRPFSSTLGRASFAAPLARKPAA